MSTTPLLRNHSKQIDLFVCDIFDAVPKGDMASMEHPIFTLSTKPDLTQRRYEHNGNYIEVNPSHYGLATVHDRDILIYCISQVVNALNNGLEISKTLRFKAYDLLKATNRPTNGSGYKNLKTALNRLQSTQIETNIKTGEIEELNIFSLIDKAKIIRKTRDGRMLDIELTLSDWVFNAIEKKEVLTYHRDYFRLRKPLERRLYEIARKHCGRKKEWSIKLPLLYKKTGSKSSDREFKRLLKNIIEQNNQHQHFPDYFLSYSEKTDLIIFKNRDTWWKDKPNDPKRTLPTLDTEIYDKAKEIAPLFDIYGLEHEFREWWAKSKKPAPNNIEKAFLGFCKQRANKDKQQNLL